MMHEFQISEATIASLKAAEAAKTESATRGVAAVVALTGDIAGQTPRHGDAAKLAASLKEVAGFKSAIAKLYSEKAVQCTVFVRGEALLAIKGKKFPTPAAKAAAFEEALAASLAGLATCKTLAALAAKVRPAKEAVAPEVATPETATPETATPETATPALVWGDIIALWAAGYAAAQKAAIEEVARLGGRVPEFAAPTAPATKRSRKTA